MRRAYLGYVFAVLLVSPACGSADRPGVNSRDTTATDRASHVTNDTDTADPQRPATPDRDRQATGTAGSATGAAEQVEGAGPDATITMKIQSKYADDDVVKGRNIEVDTADGVVTLKGEVDSLRERDAAEQLARETAGVKRVVNELKVAPTR
jgi:osmotically-inducible protein OsmY